MTFQAVEKKENPAVLFFHAMGVTGESSRPVAAYLKGRYYCMIPTSNMSFAKRQLIYNYAFYE